MNFEFIMNAVYLFMQPSNDPICPLIWLWIFIYNRLLFFNTCRLFPCLLKMPQLCLYNIFFIIPLIT